MLYQCGGQAGEGGGDGYQQGGEEGERLDCEPCQLAVEGKELEDVKSQAKGTR